MRTIIKAAAIYTMDSKDSVADYMIIENQIVTEIGSSKHLVINSNDRIINYANKTILPSFNDTHMHLIGYGASLVQCNFSYAKSILDFKKILYEFTNSQAHVQNNTWIIGRGWNHDSFIESRLPNRFDLDEVCSDKPVLIYRACGHIAVINTFALNILKFDLNSNIEGGHIDFENGVCTGIFRENALKIIQDYIPAYSEAQITNFISIAAKKLHSFGITSVQSDDLIVVPPEKQLDLLNLFHRLSETGQLNLRLYEQSQFVTKENLVYQIENGYKQNMGNDFFKLGPLKILADGSLGARTARLSESYRDAPNEKGILLYDENKLKELIDIAFKNDLDVAIHAIGDYTVGLSINMIGEVSKIYSRKNNRNTIVHCQIMKPEFLKSMREYNISALVQPVFLEYDMTIAHERVGKELAKSSYAYKSMLANQIKLGFGSDAPVEDPNPFRSIALAVTRTNHSGLKYYPEEMISIYDAIKAFTSDAAYFSYEENKKGKLLPNYLADFVVLSCDPLKTFPTALSTIVVEATYLNGTCVYNKKQDA